MLRMRRYRVFLIFAVFITAALYHFRAFGDLENAGAASVDGLRNFGLKKNTEDTTIPASSESPVSESPVSESLVSEPKEHVAQEEESQDKETLEKGAQDLRYDDTFTSNTPTEVLPVSTTRSSITQIKDSISSVTSTASLIPDQNIIQKPVNFEPNQNGTVGLQDGDSGDSTPDDTYQEHSEGRQDINKGKRPTTIHWSRQSEHFPVPTASIIQLPTGRPKALPKIQHVFSDESANDKIDREQKLDTIKKTFAYSWAGYKEKAWMQDEVSPVSGNYRNPFCGWAATLVDSLDSLWILGMKEEFEEATNALKDIDFTTTERHDIPLFETVIRYLGGLIAAYDLSSGKYRILLDKAVELAEILMGAFDTPNRMPMTFYLWKPTFASQPHRANTRVVLAEIGSLSVEFTRLAQITRESKYYDAIARITNEFESWQNNTKLPGLWPLSLDASGCKKPDMSSTSPIDHSSLNGPGTGSDRVSNSSVLVASEQNATVPIDTLNTKKLKDRPIESSGVIDSEENDTKDAKAPNTKSTIQDVSKSNVNISKRQLSDEEATSKTNWPEMGKEEQPDCEPQGLTSPPGSGAEEFSLGGMADSVYEYLPKQYMLTGGLEDVYRRMYEAAMETAKAHLLFRPMLPNDRNILLSGLVRTSGDLNNPIKTTLRPEGTHLTCFTGGMFAIGAKIFNRDSDMEIAKKLTDGCVWAYEATVTGIMPEHYLATPCKSQETCAWNETLYHEALDPHREIREESRKTQQQQLDLNEKQRTTPEKASDKAKEDKKFAQYKPAESTIIDIITSVAETASAVDAAPTVEAAVLQEKEESFPKLEKHKRQLVDIESEVPLKSADEVAGTPTSENIPEANGRPTNGTDSNKKEPSKNGKVESQAEPEAEPIAKWTDDLANLAEPAETPEHIPTHEEFVKDKIRDERLPIGMTKVTGSKYILRPEAIESVFIMYRTTGDSYWREKGWAMFQAIHKYTNATYGASAISDVTQNDPTALDEMESFWLAETLKYFYLLFSDPGVISLDEYVLNTEAHPLKRPKPA